MRKNCISKPAFCLAIFVSVFGSCAVPNTPATDFSVKNVSGLYKATAWLATDTNTNAVVSSYDSLLTCQKNFMVRFDMDSTYHHITDSFCVPIEPFHGNGTWSATFIGKKDSGNVLIIDGVKYLQVYFDDKQIIYSGYYQGIPVRFSQTLTRQ